MITKTKKQLAEWTLLEGEPELTVCRLCEAEGTAHARLLHEKDTCGVFSGLPCDCDSVIVRTLVSKKLSRN